MYFRCFLLNIKYSKIPKPNIFNNLRIMLKNYAKQTNDPIQMLWIGKALSRIEYLCMQSFLSNGHPVHLYAYEKIDNVPQDVTFCDANQILPQHTIFKHMGSYAAFADLFRWKLMVEKGGWYCDTDVICLRPFEFNQEIVLGWQDKNECTPTIMKFPTNHPLAKELLNAAKYPSMPKPYDSLRVKTLRLINRLFTQQQNALGWGETAGPSGLTRAYFYLLKQGKIDFQPISPNYFYPIAWQNWQDLITANKINLEQLPSESCAIHLWNEMWRRGNIDKNKPLDPNCLVEKLFKLYCPNYPA
ncbi:hypothetical protein CEP48_04200 [Mergibacter septicus]|uniref:Uncharacterized protein n=2 Tax=Mergibacter septicus TaxID=221402 RepID=A0A8E3S9X8_9PAST|nr:hypothetical protein CEP47_04205 [Mergibacter septicus]QDJ14674.1 hypothetical protein CEP48_04200 [Mergibacter septicus]